MMNEIRHLAVTAHSSLAKIDQKTAKEMLITSTIVVSSVAMAALCPFVNLLIFGGTAALSTWSIYKGVNAGNLSQVSKASYLFFIALGCLVGGNAIVATISSAKALTLALTTLNAHKMLFASFQLSALLGWVLPTVYSYYTTAKDEATYIDWCNRLNDYLSKRAIQSSANANTTIDTSEFCAIMFAMMLPDSAQILNNQHPLHFIMEWKLASVNFIGTLIELAPSHNIPEIIESMLTYANDLQLHVQYGGRVPRGLADSIFLTVALLVNKLEPNKKDTYKEKLLKLLIDLQPYLIEDSRKKTYPAVDKFLEEEGCRHLLAGKISNVLENQTALTTKISTASSFSRALKQLEENYKEFEPNWERWEELDRSLKQGDASVQTEYDQLTQGLLTGYEDLSTKWAGIRQKHDQLKQEILDYIRDYRTISPLCNNPQIRKSMNAVGLPGDVIVELDANKTTLLNKIISFNLAFCSPTAKPDQKILKQIVPEHREFLGFNARMDSTKDKILGRIGQLKSAAPVVAYDYLTSSLKEAFKYEDYQDLQEWLHCEELDEDLFKDKLSKIGLATLEDLKTHQIVADDLTKAEIKVRLKNYIDANLHKLEDGGALSNNSSSSLSQNVTTISQPSRARISSLQLEKIQTIAYRALYHLSQTLIFVTAVIASPSQAIAGFTIGLGARIVKKIPVPLFIHEILHNQYLKPYFDFLSTSILHFGPNETTHHLEFMRSDFTTKLKLLATKFGKAWVGSLIEPWVGFRAFAQGYALGSETTEKGIEAWETLKRRFKRPRPVAVGS